MSDEGAGGGSFPETRWSAIVAARSDDPHERRRGIERITEVYWKPIYKYVRVRWSKSRPDAEDLTQEFFARLIEKRFLAPYDPAKARLRVFLRTCVDGVVQNEARAGRAQKRGGDARSVPLDFDVAEGELARSTASLSETPEAIFEREWARSVFEKAVDRLAGECAAGGKEIRFTIFERYDLSENETSYAGLAAELGISPSDVTNHLAYARRLFRRITLDLLREMTASDEEFRREARSLLGAKPGRGA